MRKLNVFFVFACGLMVPVQVAAAISTGRPINWIIAGVNLAAAVLNYRLAWGKEYRELRAARETLAYYKQRARNR